MFGRSHLAALLSSLTLAWGATACGGRGGADTSPPAAATDTAASATGAVGEPAAVAEPVAPVKTPPIDDATLTQGKLELRPGAVHLSGGVTQGVLEQLRAEGVSFKRTRLVLYGETTDADLKSLVRLPPPVRHVLLAGELGEGLRGVTDLSPIGRLDGLKTLAISFAPSLHDLAGLEGAKGLKNLSVEATQCFRMDAVAGLSELVALVLVSDDEACAPNLAAVARNKPKLVQLQVGGGKLTDLTPLIALPSLRELELVGVTGGLDALAKLSALEGLALRQGKVPSLAPLAALPKLRKLELSFMELGAPESLRALRTLRSVKARPAFVGLDDVVDLPELDLLDLWRAEPASWKALGRAKKLTRLRVDESTFDDAAILAELPLLTRFRCRKCQLLRGLEALADHPALEQLVVSGAADAATSGLDALRKKRPGLQITGP